MIFDYYVLNSFSSDFDNGLYLGTLEVSDTKFDVDLFNHSKKHGQFFGLGLYSRVIILEKEQKYLADYGSYSYFLGYQRKNWL